MFNRLVDKYMPYDKTNKLSWNSDRCSIKSLRDFFLTINARQSGGCAIIVVTIWSEG